MQPPANFRNTPAKKGQPPSKNTHKYAQHTQTAKKAPETPKTNQNALEFLGISLGGRKVFRQRPSCAACVSPTRGAPRPSPAKAPEEWRLPEEDRGWPRAILAIPNSHRASLQLILGATRKKKGIQNRKMRSFIKGFKIGRVSKQMGSKIGRFPFPRPAFDWL